MRRAKIRIEIDMVIEMADGSEMSYSEALLYGNHIKECLVTRANNCLMNQIIISECDANSVLEI